MSLKCEECGFVNWSAATSCVHCGAGLYPSLSGEIYSDGRESADSKSTHIRPFFKALVYSFIIEFLVLTITGAATVRSFFSHSAADPNSASSNILAQIGIFFHLPSFAITAPLGLLFLAPLVQIALMTAILTFLFRLRRQNSELRRYNLR